MSIWFIRTSLLCVWFHTVKIICMSADLNYDHEIIYTRLLKAAKKILKKEVLFFYMVFLYRYGFMKEIIHKYKSNSTRLLRLFESIYSWLPVASLIDDNIFVTHGGVSNITDLATINSIKRQKVFFIYLNFVFCY